MGLWRCFDYPAAAPPVGRKLRSTIVVVSQFKCGLRLQSSRLPVVPYFLQAECLFCANFCLFV